jgi:hypothetical protein
MIRLGMTAKQTGLSAEGSCGGVTDQDTGGGVLRSSVRHMVRVLNGGSACRKF